MPSIFALPPAPLVLREDDCPLDLILAEHARQRVAFGQLDRLAAMGAIDRAGAERLIRHLVVDLPLHWRDEEEDLFPLLRRRAEPDDAIAEALQHLAVDHGASAQDAGLLADALTELGRGRRLGKAAAARFRAFAARERRRLVFENAVLLRLARARLTRDDRRALLRRMAGRRDMSLIPASAQVAPGDRP